MELELWFMKMAIFMKDSGKVIKNEDLEGLYGQTEIIMMESLRMIENLDLDQNSALTDMSKRDIGMEINETKRAITFEIKRLRVILHNLHPTQRV